MLLNLYLLSKQSEVVSAILSESSEVSLNLVRLLYISLNFSEGYGVLFDYYR
jgi:hypothetical protein